MDIMWGGRRGRALSFPSRTSPAPTRRRVQQLLPRMAVAGRAVLPLALALALLLMAGLAGTASAFLMPTRSATPAAAVAAVAFTPTTTPPPMPASVEGLRRVVLPPTMRQQQRQQRQQRRHASGPLFETREAQETPSSFPSSKQTDSVVSMEVVQEELAQAELAFETQLKDAVTVSEAESLRREYLGRKGPVAKVMGYMKGLSDEDKPKLGVVVNQVKDRLEKLMVDAMEALVLQEMEAKMLNERIDVTMPGLSRSADIGRRHPLSMTMERAVDIFVKLGYDTVTDAKDSPEIETDYYCFEALNCPKDHPARDMQDTFYLTEDRELLLRTQTSSVQIRQLERRKPPLRIVAPGKVYRKDDIDATHSLMFHQVEILALEKYGELDLGHLKGTIEHFCREMLGPDIETRFRGSFFPFTEPSMEVDVKFRGKWMEVLGCGMVDPRVLEKAGIDPKEYGGFAAGFGVERFAMIIHGIKDLREFVKSDKRFLQQFPHFYDDGVPTFLAGEPPYSPPPDLRTDELPDPLNPVLEWEDLETYKYPPQVTDDEEVDGGAAVSNDQPPKKRQDKAKQETKVASDVAATETTDIDISKLDIRVGLIVKAWEHPEADKLYCEEIDLGEASGPRQIASGLKDHYTLDEMNGGRRVLVLANLKSRKLVGFPSHGMVLCAASEDGSTVQFIEPPADAKVGERVMVDGFEGEPATENQVLKKKMLDAIFPHLKTNGEGVATYRGIPLTTSAGPCKAASLINAPIA